MTTSRTPRLLAILATACCLAAPAGLAANRSEVEQNPRAENSAAQRRAAEEYLAALARGDPRVMAMTIHEDELDQLRLRLLDEMKLEADRDESLVRERLFGAGMPLTDIERLTPQNFFVALAPRLRFGGREFVRVNWLEAVNDSGGMVQMLGRLIPDREKGSVEVPVVVSIVPWGKDWKAAFPLELQAQIDDLRTGRVNPPGQARVVAPAGSSTPAPSTAPAAAAISSPLEVLELFAEARKNLEARDCDDYYRKQMSPNFRRTTGTRALRTLITTCENREELRAQMLTALKLASERAPRFQYAGTRAVYDLSGQGLPYPSLTVEQVDERWYIAE
jgi:hypothetical protein